MRLAALFCLGLAAPAAADVTVSFRDGAPKDTFTITNGSGCALEQARIAIDFDGSAGQLVYDITASGAGVEVFQPFEVVRGAAALASLPDVKDGDTFLSLSIRALAPGDSIAFTIDVDDTIGAREITVTGSEIAGASATLSAGRMDEDIASARFSDAGTAVIRRAPCA